MVTEDRGRWSMYLASGCHRSRPSETASIALVSSENLCLKLLRGNLQDFAFDQYVHLELSWKWVLNKYLLGAYKCRSCIDHMQNFTSERYCESCIYQEDHLHLDKFAYLVFPGTVFHGFRGHC